MIGLKNKLLIENGVSSLKYKIFLKKNKFGVMTLRGSNALNSVQF